MQTDLKAYLKKKKVSEIVIIGFMTNVSIDATVRAGKEFGFACTVISDACTTKSFKLEKEKVKAELIHAAFLATINQHYGSVMNSRDYIKKEKKVQKKELKAQKAAAAERELEKEESFS